ncbi:hypothetical protein ABKN59_001106 [Abortiporus biennis]
MGFCRRCGDIVVGARCAKCGGSSVAPVVKWNHDDSEKAQDRWSKTYVTSPAKQDQPLNPINTGSNNSPSKRFPRPQSTSSLSSTSSQYSYLGSRVSAHIASATTSRRPPSPLKHSASASEDSNAEEGILPNLSNGTELAKVYGSVLQPKETLASYACAICSTPFPPDATIYPDPSSLNSSGMERPGDGSGTRFLCRSCFTVNGGSKGDCPTCHRPVLILKSEGGFVETAGSVWHKRCFCCDGCDKYIGDSPMVDLLGRPSCADCFDTCLTRSGRDSMSSPLQTPDKRSTLGGVKRSNKSREGSPALEELEQRLGIVRSRESTPARDDPILARLNSPTSSPFNLRYQPSKDNSPTAERLSSRSRALSTPSATSSPTLSHSSASTPNRILNRYMTPEPDSSSADESTTSTSTSPSLLRHSYLRMKGSDLDTGDESSASSLSYNSLKSSEPDVFTSSPRTLGSRTASPHTGSPAMKPTEAAIEEMKQRFLNKAGSPSPTRTPTNATPLASTCSSTATTPTRRRSRSRPRFSDASTIIGDDSSRRRDRESRRRSLRPSTSTSSLRSALKPQTTGGTEFTSASSSVEPMRPMRTGESILPLVSQRTGTSDFSSVKRDTTGETTFTSISRQRTGNGEDYSSTKIRRQRTGDSTYAVHPQRTGDSLYPQRTGETEFTVSVRRQRTGDTEFAFSVRRQRNGERRESAISEVKTHRTGETNPLRDHRTGDTTISTLQSQSSIEKDLLTLQSDLTGETSYTVQRDRTGDAEVESLLGEIYPTKIPEDLIDLSVPSSDSASSTGSMSKIPRPRYGGLRKSTSSTSIRTGYTADSALSSLTYSSSVSSVSVPPTPDLAGDFSDTMSTRSSAGPATPPSDSPPAKKHTDHYSKHGTVQSQYSGSKHHNSTHTSLKHRSFDARPTERGSTPKSKKQLSGIDVNVPPQLPSDTRCAKCLQPLFSKKFGGKFVSVPEEPTSTGVPPKVYHTSCFNCNVCGEVFEEKEGGHAVFVRDTVGACHVRCAPPEKITLRQVPSIAKPSFKFGSTTSQSSSIPSSTRTTATYYSSSRYEQAQPAPTTAPPTTTTFFPSIPEKPRFGGSIQCPGCSQSVSPMERGVVPGPQATKWHSSCLICGGKEAKGRRKDVGKPGCGKKLDSAAKTDADGRVWCRECLLLLPISLRQPSPVRSPTFNGIQATSTGNNSFRGPFVSSQHTGTTIARQFTGVGGSNDAALLRQLTGGGLSPTRQLSSSPTKSYDGPRPGRVYPRPKSVTGYRSVKTDLTGEGKTGEGRGMYLVRQLTGGTGSFASND